MKEMEARRSIRKYLDKPVESVKLHQLIESARLAPSGSNCQDWDFIILKTEEARQKCMEVCYNQAWMTQAPIHIICVAGIEKREPELIGTYIDENSPQLAVKRTIRDASIAIEHIVLEAVHQGLGTCWIGDYDQDVIRPAFGIPDDKYVAAVLTVGYAAEAPDMRPRKDIDDICRYEKW